MRDGGLAIQDHTGGRHEKNQSETDSSAFWAEDRLLEKREQLRRQTGGRLGTDKERESEIAHCGLPLLCGQGLPGLPWRLNT